MKISRPDWKRHWMAPMLVLVGVATGAFLLAYWLDHRRSGAPGGAGLWAAIGRYLALDPGKITDAISQFAPVVVSLLGIVVTVVAIIVQLSSSRYSGVARMFIRDRVNLLVLAYYVVAAIYGVWLSIALQEDFVPLVALLASVASAIFGMALMLPYFAYVFWFLEPANLIGRIRGLAFAQVQDASRILTHMDTLGERQCDALDAITELTDIASHSVAARDKVIASRAIDAMRDFIRDYLALKDSLPPRWFAIGTNLRRNPDFVAMEAESLDDLQSRRTWMEWQVLRQYLSLYGEASNTMREINYLIAIDTRHMGEMALERGDDELVALVFRFMNSYLRATLNARDVRTAYNVLNQYRLLANAMLLKDRGDFCLQAVQHLSYYSHVSFDLTLNFITETIAYDFSALCVAAHERNTPEQDKMLRAFLKLDRPLRIKTQERALLGVRKAQVKLAAYYLYAGDVGRAALVAEDLKDENDERVAIIRGELESVTTKDFWEIIDRGRTFEFMPPAQRAQLEIFFGMLAGLQATSAGND